MKFLLDAQLPGRLGRALANAGHDVLHTSDLPNGNASSDRQVREAADEQGRVVVTKDGDFRDSHLLQGTPRRLLVLKVGNTSNATLLELFDAYGAAVVIALEAADYVELRPDELIQHPRT